ncbi:MAG: nitroreductase family protein [Chloroflexota bacterium]|nr:nitroreductase family protein [Chloroflexota bacterium]MDE2886229.1 nitroreductase family protein [Chloroflexota bacterium]
MPDFFDVVRSQRGTAYYKPDPVPDGVLHQILQAATRAPSGSNRQPWRFIVVRDREVKRRLGELYREGQHRASGGAPGRDAGEVPVHFSVGMEDVPVLVMVCVELWEMRGAEWYRGASIYPAVQNLMLAAAAHGIGTRLTTIWQHCYEDVAELLGVPDDWGAMALVPIGYPQPPDHLGGSRRKPVSEVTFYDRWGNTGA